MNKLPMLSPWLRRFFTEHISTERNLAVNTRKSYRDTFVMLLPYIATHSRKSVERLLISDITAQRVLGFLNHIETERGCTAQTRNQRLSAIRVFTRYVCSRNPACVEWAGSLRAIVNKKTRPGQVSWLTKDQIESILEVPNTRKFRGRVEYALLLFLYNTGARVSEAIGLSVSNLQFGQNNGRHALVTIMGKGGKLRQCPLWPRTEKALLELVDNKLDSDPVFVSQLGQSYTRFGVYRLVQRCAAAVPELSQRNITPHVMRHSCACHLLRAGVDLNTIRSWLGHVSLDTTNIYVAIDLDMKVDAMRICDTVEIKSPPSWKQDTKTMAFLNSL